MVNANQKRQLMKGCNQGHWKVKWKFEITDSSKLHELYQGNS